MHEGKPLFPSPAQIGDVTSWFVDDAALRVRSFGNTAGVTVLIAGRFIDADAQHTKPFSAPHTPNSDRTVATSDIPLGRGWLQTLTVIASGGSPMYGGVFVCVDVIQGRGAGATTVGTLLQGFVTSGQRLAWPGTPLRSPTESTGAFRSVAGSDPAAGAEISETVPTGARWQVLAITATLVSDGTAANRRPRLTIDDGTTVYFVSPSGNTQTATQTIVYTWAIGAPLAATLNSSFNLHGLPAPHWLRAGHRIQTVTASIQAGDNWGAPQLWVEERLEAA
jgi:hypothetical protein